jgi:fructoselysine-6-P-deglycase FrlB-like protein
MAQAMAAWRETRGDGDTDAFPASEMPLGRSYDLVVAISRSGTTTEVTRLIEALGGRTRVLVLTAVPGTPVTARADDTVVLDFADEEAIVQTRFATSVLALWRAHLGHDVESLARCAEEALTGDLPEPLDTFRQFVFLGRGAGAALASEAALKFREAALSWSEAYPALEFRHGPISVISDETLVWPLGELDVALRKEILDAGATVTDSCGDPMVDLVRVHRAAVALADAKGLDPDHPQRLTRSVILA